MQQSGGLLLATGLTVAIPYIVPGGHNGTESHYPPVKYTAKRDTRKGVSFFLEWNGIRKADPGEAGVINSPVDC